MSFVSQLGWTTFLPGSYGDTPVWVLRQYASLASSLARPAQQTHFSAHADIPQQSQHNGLHQPLFGRRLAVVPLQCEHTLQVHRVVSGCPDLSLSESSVCPVHLLTCLPKGSQTFEGRQLSLFLRETRLVQILGSFQVLQRHAFDWDALLCRTPTVQKHVEKVRHASLCLAPWPAPRLCSSTPV